MRTSFLTSIAAAAIISAPLVLAGPPLICHPFQISGARSLPWGSGPDWDSPAPNYDLANLNRDTLNLLNPKTPILVRMETLRRAGIYSTQDAARAEEMLAALGKRAAAEPANALAQFDYGYFAATLHQLAYRFNNRDLSSGVDSRGLVEKAIALQPDNPEMHFAAAIMLAKAEERVARQEHLAKARAGKPSEMLAVNLASHF